MSRTPETMIDKPRKFFHDVCMTIARVFFTLGLAALLATFAGGSVAVFIVLMAIAFVFSYVASKIKYTWKKKIEVGGFELV